MSKASNDIYKPNNYNKRLASVLLIFAGLIFILFFIAPDNYIVNISVSALKKLGNDSVCLTCVESISLVIFILFILDYIIINVVLCFIILKDDGAIKFEKLNELKRIEANSKELSNSYVVYEETIIDNNNINERKCVTKKENPKLEFYKKYLDTIADI